MGSEYATIWLSMSEQDENIPESVWIFCVWIIWQGSEYVSYDT